MSENPQNEPGTLTAQQAAILLEITPHRIRQLVDEGAIPPPTKRNTYSLVGVVRGYIRWLKDDTRRVKVSEAEAALRAARQREIEIRTAEREGKLVDFADVEAFVSHAMQTFRARLEALPAAITRDHRLRVAAERYVDGAIEGFHRAFLDAAEHLRAGSDPFAGEQESD